MVWTRSDAIAVEITKHMRKQVRNTACNEWVRAEDIYNTLRRKHIRGVSDVSGGGFLAVIFSMPFHKRKHPDGSREHHRRYWWWCDPNQSELLQAVWIQLDPREVHNRYGQ